MNLADLSTFLGFIIFSIFTPVSANGAGAPFWLAVTLVPVGIGIGAGAAYLNHRLMYRFLGVKLSPKDKNEGNLFLYMLYPFASITLSIAASAAIGNLAARMMK